MFTSRQTIWVAATLTSFAIGLLIYEVQLSAQWREQLRTAQIRNQALAAQGQRLRHVADTTTDALNAAQQQLAALEEKLGAAQAAEGTTAAETKAWLARLHGLRAMLAQHPEAAIPELNGLSEREWLLLAKNAQFDPPEEARRSLAALRNFAKGKFVANLSIALRHYSDAAGGSLPPTPDALAPLMNPPADPGSFRRYEMVTGADPTDPRYAYRPVIRERAAIDEDYDERFGVDANFVPMGGGNYVAPDPIANARAWLDSPDGYDGMVRRAQSAYAQANHGAKADGLEQLGPYLNPPLPGEKLQQLIALENRLKH